MGKIAGMLGEVHEESTPLQKRLDQLGRYIAAGCLAVCAIVAGAGIMRGEPLMEMLLTGVSLAVAAVPEGLPAIVTISLALAVGRMVRQKALIRRLHAVETLGCADVICSDKTGENRAGERFLLVKGGYDVLLERCGSVMRGGEVCAITPAIRRCIGEENSRMAENALRVLGFAWKPLPSGKGLTEEAAAAEGGLIFAGLAGMMDPPRREAREAVAVSRKAGIKTVMITGDHPVTARAVAKELGIWREGDRILTGSDLEKMEDAALESVIEKTSVFARVSPGDKLRIVRAFKKRGHITAMTGDGVNDAPAVREADIGVAMGASGTDVTREAAVSSVT